MVGLARTSGLFGGTANKVRIEHGYDRASNRKWRQDDVARGLSVYLDEYYNYDDVNQLTNVDRGELNGTQTGIVTGTVAWKEDFTLDPLGNWTGYVQTTAGTVTLDQDRLHNKANEIDNDDDHTNAPDDSITSSGGTPDWADPKQDAVGNMTIVPKPSSLTDGLTLKYDAWNRLVKVFEADGTTQVAGYQYDGRNRRIVKKTYEEGDPSETRHFYQSTDNQVLEERVAGHTGIDRQNVWGIRYIDDLVLRDWDSDHDGQTGDGDLGVNGSGLDERLFAMQDANWNAVAIADTSGSVVERYKYTAYGEPSFLDPTTFAVLDPNTSAYSWDTLYTGRQYDPETGLYNYRARYYDAELGRFIGRDLIGYKGKDANLYRYVGDSPINKTDPLGLYAVCCRTSYQPLPIGPYGVFGTFDFPFQHCWATSGSCPKDSTETPASVDNSPDRCMNGKPCSKATAAEIQACMNDHAGSHGYPNQPYSCIGNNCNTAAIQQLGQCCLKSSWSPPWYAGNPRGKCLKGHTVTLYGYMQGSQFVCDQWELPDWQN